MAAMMGRRIRRFFRSLAPTPCDDAGTARFRSFFSFLPFSSVLRLPVGEGRQGRHNHGENMEESPGLHGWLGRGAGGANSLL